MKIVTAMFTACKYCVTYSENIPREEEETHGRWVGDSGIFFFIGLLIGAIIWTITTSRRSECRQQ
jgi:hypothetical protein